MCSDNLQTKAGNKMQEKKGANGSRLKWHLSWAIPIVLGVLGWFFMEQLADREFRLSGDRFTQSDAYRMREELVQQRRDDIRSVANQQQQMDQRLLGRLEELQGQITENHNTVLREIADLPPDDWERRIEKLETTVEQLRLTVERLRTQLDQHWKDNC